MIYLFVIPRDLNDFLVIETRRDDVKEIERQYRLDRIIIKSFEDNSTAVHLTRVINKSQVIPLRPTHTFCQFVCSPNFTYTYIRYMYVSATRSQGRPDVRPWRPFTVSRYAGAYIESLRVEGIFYRGFVVPDRCSTLCRVYSVYSILCTNAISATR